MTRSVRRLVAGLCLALASLAAVAADAPVEGTWQKHEYQLHYMGSTSHYSCSGIEDKLKRLLLLAGARPDARVNASCSNMTGGPSAIVTARVKFYALAPAAPAPAPTTAAAPALPGRQLGRDAPALPREIPTAGVGAWKTVEWRAGTPADVEAGDCELVEQFAREILPLFTVRNVEAQMRCVPHQLPLGSIQLKFSVLAGLPPAEANKAAAKPQ